MDENCTCGAATRSFSLSDEELAAACKNIGFDLKCGACAEPLRGSARRKPFVPPPPAFITPTTMTVKHPRWSTFVERLEGSDGCTFRKDVSGRTVWKCSSTIAREYATKILKQMHCDVPSSLAYFAQHGGYCDCEILFNVERSAKNANRRERKRVVAVKGRRKNPKKAQSPT